MGIMINNWCVKPTSVLVRYHLHFVIVSLLFSFFTSQIVKALEHLHSNLSVIHRGKQVEVITVCTVSPQSHLLYHSPDIVPVQM